MAKSLKSLRRRLRTVKSTQKITRAMETVSAVKLRRAQERLKASRPYADQLAELVRALSDDETAQEHPLCQERPIRRRTVVVITADRGLCGAFNANVLRQLDRFIAEHGEGNVEVAPVGKRATGHCRRRGYDVVEGIPAMGTLAPAAEGQALAQRLMQRFTAEETDDVSLLFTEMLSLIRFEPTFERLLPLDLGKGDAESDQSTIHFRLNYIFEPSAAAVLGAVLPRTAESRLFLALAQSSTSEHSARRMAMHNATDNCKELGTQLTLEINKARQASITKEILEIVGGAEALKG